MNREVGSSGDSSARSDSPQLGYAMNTTVGIRLNPRNRHQPLHRQLFDVVAARIQAGAFPPGFKLPPMRTLAAELGLHRNTIARAYADLELAGFVNSSVGRGTFVEKISRRSRVRSAQPATNALDFPWNSLMSRAAQGEAIGRADRHKWQGPHTKDTINLARMQPGADLIPASLLRRCFVHALDRGGTGALGYAPAEGIDRLREQIARDLVERGVPVSADEVIVTSGSQQGLDLIARAMFNPGDTLMVEPTTYAGTIDLFSLAGARLIPVPMDAEGPNMAALQRLARPEVKGLYVMPNAHNPTGLTLSAERRHALVDWSRARGVPIIEDDYAAGIVLDDSTELPHLRALDGEVIHISTFSKRLAPALRMGYVVAPPALRPVLLSIKRIVDLGTSVSMQHALAEFMERGYLRAHEKRIRSVYRAQRDALSQALRESLPNSLDWDVPTHGVVMWVRLPAGIDPQRVSAEAERRGVLVSPSSLFSVAERSAGAIRLVFSAEPAARLAEGARRLGTAIGQVLSEGARRPAPGLELSEMI